MAHPFHDQEIDVTPERAAEMIRGGVQLVDVRESYEHDAGRIEGARHIELERLASQAENLDKDAPVLFYCRLGARSGMAAQAFRRAGFESYSLTGGLQAWMTAACLWSRRMVTSRIIERAGLALAATLILAAPAGAAPSLVEIGRFSRPVHAVSPPQDLRLFVVEQQTGLVKILDAGGTILPQPFLDLHADIATDDNERGLLSIAFAPDYATGGLLYAYLTPPGRVEVREYRRTATDANRAEPTGRTLISIDHRANGNHNGGLVTFGPDGMLWAGVGDGGSANDPPNNAQNPEVQLGKLLRVNPAAGPFPAGNGAIFALGLRNPWRFSFDRATGDLIIGDVGQAAREEVDFAPAAQDRLPGANYGWRCLEGSQPTPGVNPPCNPPDDVLPVHELLHSNGACSITGGIVVRDAGLPSLAGRYLYGDYCLPALRSVTLPAAGDDRAETGLRVDQVVSFSEDACGRVLVASLTGPVYRVVDGAPSPCSFTPAPGEPPPPAAAPQCGLSVAVPRSRSVRTVVRRGLAVFVRVRGACRVGATARLKGGGTLVAPSRSLVAGQRVALRLRAGARTRARLRRRAPVLATVTVKARPAGGAAVTLQRRVRIRR